MIVSGKKMMIASYTMIMRDLDNIHNDTMMKDDIDTHMYSEEVSSSVSF